MLGLVFCINSSKVYCKFKFTCSECSIKKVLIVAKCIVNSSLSFRVNLFWGINSSKVYCKYNIHRIYKKNTPCINSSKVYCKRLRISMPWHRYICINSSKVYCK